MTPLAIYTCEPVAASIPTREIDNVRSPFGRLRYAQQLSVVADQIGKTPDFGS
jgi:hypothetical protein